MQITIVGVMMTEWLKNIDLPLSDQVWAGLGRVITIKYSQIRIQLDTAPTITNNLIV